MSLEILATGLVGVALLIPPALIYFLFNWARRKPPPEPTANVTLPDRHVLVVGGDDLPKAKRHFAVVEGRMLATEDHGTTWDPIIDSEHRSVSLDLALGLGAYEGRREPLTSDCSGFGTAHELKFKGGGDSGAGASDSFDSASTISKDHGV